MAALWCSPLRSWPRCSAMSVSSDGVLEAVPRYTVSHTDDGSIEHLVIAIQLPGEAADMLCGERRISMRHECVCLCPFEQASSPVPTSLSQCWDPSSAACMCPPATAWCAGAVDALFVTVDAGSSPLHLPALHAPRPTRFAPLTKQDIPLKVPVQLRAEKVQLVRKQAQLRCTLRVDEAAVAAQAQAQPQVSSACSSASQPQPQVQPQQQHEKQQSNVAEEDEHADMPPLQHNGERRAPEASAAPQPLQQWQQQQQHVRGGSEPASKASRCSSDDAMYAAAKEAANREAAAQCMDAASAALRSGDASRAVRLLQKACSLDPGSQGFAAALADVRRVAAQQQKQAAVTGDASGSSKQESAAPSPPSHSQQQEHEQPSTATRARDVPARLRSLSIKGKCCTWVTVRQPPCTFAWCSHHHPHHLCQNSAWPSCCWRQLWPASRPSSGWR